MEIKGIEDRGGRRKELVIGQEESETVQREGGSEGGRLRRH